MKIKFDNLQTISNNWVEWQDKICNFYQKYADSLACEKNNFLGWKNLATSYPSKVLNDINKLSKGWENKFDTLVIIGIGGSYLGIKAGQEFIEGLYPENPKLKIYYLGNTMSSEYIYQIIKKIENSNFCINVISKSGTTLEPAFSFHKCLDILEKKFGKESFAKRVIATTDSKKGVLFEFCKKHNIPTLIIPDDIGGRYSVLTPVGLLPFSLMGFNINEILNGAKNMQLMLNKQTGINNIALKYALIRNLLFKQGNKIEAFTFFESNLSNLGEWLKQLFGESEGKQMTSLWPISIICSTDLHSLGQSLQEGFHQMFETFIKVEKPNFDVEIDKWKVDEDKMQFVVNKSLHKINYSIYEATIKAHLKNPSRNIIEVSIDKMNEYSFGEFVQFYFNVCMYSALILGVNPFDQPGVEIYKANMFKILKQ